MAKEKKDKKRRTNIKFILVMTDKEAIQILQRLNPLSSASKPLPEDAIRAIDIAIKKLSVELPQGFDDAAEEYAKGNTCYANDCQLQKQTTKNAFKAGVLWQKNQLPKWKKTSVTGGCWSGEIAVHPSARLFRYEHYVINADKLFELLSKEK